MIESLMLIALGFFIASLFAMIGAQLVWRRAVTVTRWKQRHPVRNRHEPALASQQKYNHKHRLVR